jgi:D-glycero-alpha-D-manno-heptose-7-phosphate kinase
MIISNTPFRISFFGGGTDYPTWCQKHGGAVPATTIDKYCYITCRRLPPFFEHKSWISYHQVELVHELAEIRHPSVRETLRFLNITDGLEIHHDADLPSRTGLGSSSSFTVGLLNTLHCLKKENPGKMQLATEAIYIEQQMIQENVGLQDQTLAAFGGFNRVDFDHNGEIRVKPVMLSAARLEKLQNHLMLFFSGFSRTASSIAGKQIEQIPNKTKELKEMQQMVDEAQYILEGNGDLSQFGRLLHESWLLKRGLASGVSTPYIDYLYEKALQAGADGGKILGAGGGGFVLFFVKPELQPQVKKSLDGVLQVPFKFENGGSRIIYNDGNDILGEE